MSSPPLIDLLFIGAPKCGTTFLTRRLGQHPGLFMPADEIHYYSREHPRGDEWYAEWFAEARPEQKLAENSNSYLTESSALTRIVAAQPQARILAVLRDPVQRAYSSYGMQIDRGRADADIARYLDPVESPRPHILTNGRYAALLRPWYDAFPADRIHVCRFRGIRESPDAMLAEVFSFIGVDPGFVPDATTAKDNARKGSGVPGGLKRALWWARPLLNQPALRNVVRGPLGRTIERVVSRPKTYPVLDPAIAARLRDYYADDVLDLERLTGQSFMDWLPSGTQIDDRASITAA